MASIFKWIKDCFNYVFGHESEELITKINDYSGDLSEDVKQKLIASVMLNKPKQFVEQVNDDTNHIPDKLREDLMASVLRASTLYVNPVETETVVTSEKVVEYTPVEELTSSYYPADEDESYCTHQSDSATEPDESKEPEEPDGPYGPSAECGPLEPTYDEQVETNSDELQEIIVVNESEPEIIYISKIIPSDQFVAKPVYRPYVKAMSPLPALLDGARCDQREEEHQKLREYIDTCRSIVKEQNQTIYVSKIIPSDQFVPATSTIPYIRLETPPPGLLDCDKDFAREIEHLKLKEYIREQRALIKAGEQIIPSDQFVAPINPVAPRKIISYPAPKRNPMRAFAREYESLKLREFIKEKRQAIANAKWASVFDNVLTDIETLKDPAPFRQIEVYRKQATNKFNEKYWSYYFRGFNHRNFLNNKPYKRQKILKMEHKWNQHY
jgi:hypothetical protein